MIISKKRFNEKVREALEREERERYIHEKIDRIDRDWNDRFDSLQRYCFELEKKLATLLEEKRLG